MADSICGDQIEERASGGTSNDSLKVSKVTLVADEWLSKKGGISTINRELSIQLAKFQHLEVFLFMSKCNEKEKEQAEEWDIKLVESKRPNEEEWWKYPPKNFQTDFVIGHGSKLGKQAEYIRENYECKWIQVVHTEPEELSSFKRYAGAGAKGEEKSDEEVRLCRKADMVVGIGPKLTEVYNAKLRPGCTVFELTPGIFKEFSEVEQATEEGENFRVLIFGRGDPEDTSLKGYDLAAKSIAILHESHQDKSFFLIFMGVRNQEHDLVKKTLHQEGINLMPERLVIRAFCESREKLSKTFQEADLVIMPSRSEGFGLSALEALSAGLPILISWNTGLAQALKKLPNGTFCTVKTDEPSDWAKAIKEAREKEREIRLEETRRLRHDYKKKYSWEAQCKKLVEEMLKLGRHDLAEVSTNQHVILVPHQASSNHLQETGEEKRGSKRREEELSRPNSRKFHQGDDMEIGQQPITSGCGSPQLQYKGGVPGDCELLHLSIDIAPKWERVGILLGLSYRQIGDIKSNGNDKAYRMLMDWKRTTKSHCHYKDLYNALCDDMVRLNDVAKKFCLM